MTVEQLEKLKFPIGKFVKEKEYNSSQLEEFISILASFPQKLKSEVSHLSSEQLDTPYRPDGWTIRQVVHHCADSHMNAIIRFKHAITEERPTIKPYPEHLFAELADTKTMPVEPGLLLIEGLHARMVTLLKSVKKEDLSRIYIHPQYGTEYTIAQGIANYGWHCEHHLAHITTLKKAKNWK